MFHQANNDGRKFRGPEKRGFRHGKLCNHQDWPALAGCKSNTMLCCVQYTQALSLTKESLAFILLPHIHQALSLSLSLSATVPSRKRLFERTARPALPRPPFAKEKGQRETCFRNFIAKFPPLLLPSFLPLAKPSGASKRASRKGSS